MMGYEETHRIIREEVLAIKERLVLRLGAEATASIKHFDASDTVDALEKVLTWEYD